MSLTREEILRLPKRELLALMRGGFAIAPATLDDVEYRGISLGLPKAVERLTWKTFKKVFHRDPRSLQLRGWNVRVRQTGIEAPFEPVLKKDERVTFGHYVVSSLEGRRLPHPIERGLMIDYGAGGNGHLDPIGRLRDPIVALDEGAVDRLLGWSYLDLGYAVCGTPSFFLLERDGPLTHTVDPPRPA